VFELISLAILYLRSYESALAPDKTVNSLSSRFQSDDLAQVTLFLPLFSCVRSSSNESLIQVSSMKAAKHWKEPSKERGRDTVKVINADV